MVIDEALELARRFSSEESVAFVNGVLDAVRRRVARITPPARPYFPIQNVEKMRFRMSSAVVAPVMASMGWSAP